MDAMDICTLQSVSGVQSTYVRGTATRYVRAPGRTGISASTMMRENKGWYGVREIRNIVLPDASTDHTTQ